MIGSKLCSTFAFLIVVLSACLLRVGTARQRLPLLGGQAACAYDLRTKAPTQTSGAYDPAQWIVVKSVRVDFGSNLKDATVLLLKSKQPVDDLLRRDNQGQPVYKMNVVVMTKTGQPLYDFTSPTPEDPRRGEPYWSPPPNDFMDDLLDVKDVTGDQVPEVMFYGGFWAPTEDIRELHILQYHRARNAPGELRDIALEEFMESTWTKFQWIDFGGQMLAILAKGGGGPDDCHLCDQYHSYAVYTWDPKRVRFHRVHSIPSTGKLHTSDMSPFGEDMPYILDYLKHHRVKKPTH